MIFLYYNSYIENKIKLIMSKCSIELLLHACELSYGLPQNQFDGTIDEPSTSGQDHTMMNMF